MIEFGYALALLIGLSLGLLGGGGSILTVPVLHYIMAYPVKAAVPMSLVVVGITSGVGALAHFREGSIDLRTALAFAPPAIVGALLGAELGLKVSASVQLTVFALVLLLAAVSMYFGAQRLVGSRARSAEARKPVPLITLVGGAVGMLTGFVGVGGGFLYVPTLVLLGGLPMKQAIGTSLLLILVSCIAGVVRYRGTLGLDWTAIAIFTAIALVGVAIGTRLAQRVSQTMLRRGFAAFLLLMGAFVLLRPLLMFFVRLFDEQLAQTSYLIGCSATGTGVVIDPNRRVDQYIAAAERLGLRITAITETHIHADFISGSRELAARTGATMYLSDCGPPEWQYEFRLEHGVVLLQDGDGIRVGQVELRAVHTPGHTPEHLSFLVTDCAAAPEPMGIVTGDFVFVNDVGRPDLLEKAAAQEGSADRGARQLFRSLAWFKTLPDHLQVWPGHGAGSACGKGMSAVPQSTVGYERRFNWAFNVDDEADFVSKVLADQPEPPRYFATMKRLNRKGPAILGVVPRPERVGEHRIEELLAREAAIVDLRPAVEFAAGHLPGTLNIPFNNSFSTWAGALLPYDRDLYLLLDAAVPGRLEEVVSSLLMIGLDRVRGYVAPDALRVWTAEGRTLERVEQVAVSDLALNRKAAIILDVRGRSEWQAGHLPGAVLIPLAELPDRLEELPADQAIAVHCQGGGRSAIAASLLLTSGRHAVANLTGGFGEWLRSGLPVSHE